MLTHLLRPVLLSKSRAPDVPLTAIEAAFDELSPIPSLCFEGKESLEYQMNLNTALPVGGLSLAYFESRLFRDPFALDTVSQKMFMLKRPIIGLNFRLVYVQPISPFVASKVVRQTRALRRYE